MSDYPVYEYSITPPDRIIHRGRGCRNCTGFDQDGDLSARTWTADRERNLNQAMEIAMAQPDPVSVIGAMGAWAAHPEGIRVDDRDSAPERRIKTLLRMVDKMDHAVAAGAFRLCLRSPAPRDRHSGDWFSASYLCSGWCGRDGHSLVTQGHPLDELPDELRERKA